jgi:ankyrin repeat protein
MLKTAHELIREMREILDDAVMEEKFKWAVYHGDLETVKSLVENGVDPSSDNNYALRLAVIHNYADIVNFLTTDPRVDTELVDKLAKILNYSKIIAPHSLRSPPA